MHVSTETTPYSMKCSGVYALDEHGDGDTGHRPRECTRTGESPTQQSDELHPHVVE